MSSFEFKVKTLQEHGNLGTRDYQIRKLIKKLEKATGYKLKYRNNTYEYTHNADGYEIKNKKEDRTYYIIERVY